MCVGVEAGSGRGDGWRECCTSSGLGERAEEEGRGGVSRSPREEKGRVAGRGMARGLNDGSVRGKLLQEGGGYSKTGAGGVIGGMELVWTESGSDVGRRRVVGMGARRERVLVDGSAERRGG